MDLNLPTIFALIASDPSLAVILVLVLGVTAVSGATDAPNAVAAAVSTRSIKPTTALVLASVFDCVGLVLFSYISTAVAHTMFAMVDFSGDAHLALHALVAAMVGAIFWGVFCWWRGIPISKSHALIAGITGGAIALHGISGVVPEEWVKVLLGMAFSLVAGFTLGWGLVKVVKLALRRVSRAKSSQICVVAQDILACVTAFLHGAQDGQKFMSIAMMGIMLSLGVNDYESQGFPVWLMLACSAALAAGLFLGGKRIIKSVGMNMVKLERYQGVAASASTIVTLFVASMTGMPVSTSHCSTSAIMGVGAEKSIRRVNWDLAKSMVFAWVITFPACGVIGYVLAKLFIML